MNSSHRIQFRHAAFAVMLLALALAGSNPADSQQQATTAKVASPSTPPTVTYTVLYDFPQVTAPSNPAPNAIAQGRNGAFYTTSQFGDDGVFSATTAGVVNVVYATGGNTLSGVTLGSDGNLYGSDLNGGIAGNCGFDSCGQVYKVSPAGVFTVLHNFTNTANVDGSFPHSAPIEGTEGNYYGTTPDANGVDGTVYKVSSSGMFTTLHTFTGSDGDNPEVGLVQGTDGNFYGVATAGGTNNDGVIFKMTPAGTVTVLHDFDFTDGYNANTSLIQASDGNFYGTTYQGGSDNNGVVFKITPSGTYTVIHNFIPANGDAGNPSASLVQATNGLLYGVTPAVNSSDHGTIFSVTTTGTLTTLWNFDGGTGGDNPQSPLRQDTNGKFYSVTMDGGDLSMCDGGGCGVFYSFDVGLGPFVSLVSTSGKIAQMIGILGQGFSASSVVKFDAVQATTITVAGSTFINATVPPGALTGLVTVTTGATTLTSNQKFRVTPAITSFTPTSGPVGTPVMITGSGLTQTTKVTFGGVAATTVTVNSDTQVTADVPTGAVTGKIVITTPGGTATSMTTFTVN